LSLGVLNRKLRIETIISLLNESSPDLVYQGGSPTFKQRIKNQQKNLLKMANIHRIGDYGGGDNNQGGQGGGYGRMGGMGGMMGGMGGKTFFPL
jgi:hypothetical protein